MPVRRPDPNIYPSVWTCIQPVHMHTCSGLVRTRRPPRPAGQKVAIKPMDDLLAKRAQFLQRLHCCSRHIQLPKRLVPHLAHKIKS